MNRLIDWFKHHINLNRIILFFVVRESGSQYIFHKHFQYRCFLRVISQTVIWCQIFRSNIISLSTGFKIHFRGVRPSSTKSVSWIWHKTDCKAPVLKIWKSSLSLLLCVLWSGFEGIIYGSNWSFKKLFIFTWSEWKLRKNVNMNAQWVPFPNHKTLNNSRWVDMPLISTNHLINESL